MGKKEAVPNRQYSEEFKAEAVRLGLSIGGNAAAKRPPVRESGATPGLADRPACQTGTASAWTCFPRLLQRRLQRRVVAQPVVIAPILVALA